MHCEFLARSSNNNNIRSAIAEADQTAKRAKTKRTKSLSHFPTKHKHTVGLPDGSKGKQEDNIKY